MHVAPLFIAETSPNDLRGRLVSFKEAAIVLGQGATHRCGVFSSASPSSPLLSSGTGIVAGYGAGAFFGEANNWHGVFQSALPFEALMVAGAAQGLPT
jgi:hypothetical protein